MSASSIGVGSESVKSATATTDGNGGGRERSLANLRPFPPGQSGNPGGGSRRQRLQHEARWSGEHGPEKTLAVLNKLLAQALAGDVPSAKLYLDRIVGAIRPDKAAEVDLRDAPAAVLDWLETNGIGP